jgi:N-acetylglutamate synthase-like GNAT family acetyltransferase
MYTIKTPATRDEFKAYYALRYKILREPWGHPKGTEKDDYEPISEHFMAVNEKGETVGVVKLYEKSDGVGYISHLAVAQEHQHKGIGHLLLKTAEEHARARGFRALGTMARSTATVYFERYGFHIAGMPAPHIGTTHLVWMEKSLAS